MEQTGYCCEAQALQNFMTTAVPDQSTFKYRGCLDHIGRKFTIHTVLEFMGKHLAFGSTSFLYVEGFVRNASMEK